MYQTLLTKETMSPHQPVTNFESEPKKLSFHELFATLVEFRKDTVNRSVSKLIMTLEKQSATRYPDVSRALNSSFNLDDAIPVIEVEDSYPKFAGFDRNNLMAEGDVVNVEPVAGNVSEEFYNPSVNGYEIDTPESDATARASEARAYIMALTDDNFTRA